ncbi:hypothetical protein FQ087_17310 [Sporosarcina sp. ANT_H38]|uniref:hypothetical protein n=1 Tax=Sporosarcina sp. ANT_H38 TaxID=2597358 RepID=UPI0011F197BA|nr:hypothetical protein [Sporosarcina sp. ANT_H38]KAA0948748.1 hypothetical protein FQ087_17310 [Sporosarcina sp. ANT_H38]
MKQWNGLLKKEWVMMKWPLLVSALLGIIVMSFVPHLIANSLGFGEHVFELALVICFLWAGASVVAPVITLFIMLEKEIKRPDVWFHSTASIFKLVGSKAFFAILIGAVGLLIPTTILAVQFALFNTTTFIFNDLLFFGSIFIVIIFAVSITFMSIGFFFWVIDRLMKPYLRGFSIVVTIILFFVSSRLYSLLARTELYEKLILIGPIDLLKLKNPKINVEFIYLEHTETFFYTGEIIFDIFFTVVMFIVAAILFEKKVRL